MRGSWVLRRTFSPNVGARPLVASNAQREGKFSLLASIRIRNSSFRRFSSFERSSDIQDRVSPKLLEKVGALGTQAAVDALWLNNYPQPYIHGARPLKSGTKMVGSAVTLRFVPTRPDIAAAKPQGVNSPEYAAFELCGPSTVLVAAATGPWESVGGDIKFLRLYQKNCGGLVTDGSVRDTNMLQEYGFPVFSHSTTAKQGPAVMQPWGYNEVIECGGVAVRPNDVILGDDDGVVVIPRCMVEEVVRIATERERIEEIIRSELERNPGSPGIYYPFKQPVDPTSPLGGLLKSRGFVEGAKAK